jgi:hypothetical protein
MFGYSDARCSETWVRDTDVFDAFQVPVLLPIDFQTPVLSFGGSPLSNGVDKRRGFGPYWGADG